MHYAPSINTTNVECSKISATNNANIINTFSILNTNEHSYMNHYDEPTTDEKLPLWRSKVYSPESRDVVSLVISIITYCDMSFYPNAFFCKHELESVNISNNSCPIFSFDGFSRFVICIVYQKTAIMRQYIFIYKWGLLLVGEWNGSWPKLA